MTDQEQPTIQEQLGLGETEYLRLTEDELVLVMAALQVPRIAGFEFPAQVSEASLNAAKNTLRARGGALLQDDGSVAIDEEIAVMVGAMARFARLITITLKVQGDLYERYWIALGNGKPTMHSVPEPGIHQFQTIPDAVSLMLVLSGVLRMLLSDTNLPGESEFSVDMQLFDDADNMRDSEGGDELYRQLVAAELPETFAAAARQPTLNCAVAVTWPTTATPDASDAIKFAERGFWLWGVPGNKGYWMLTPDVATRQVRVTPVSPRIVMNVIGDYLTEDLPTSR